MTVRSVIVRAGIALALLGGVPLAAALTAPAAPATSSAPKSSSAKPAATKPTASKTSAAKKTPAPPASAAPPVGTPAVGTPAPTTASAGTVRGGILELDWEQLLPKEALGRPALGAGAGAAPLHDYLGEGAPAAQQPTDFRVNKELNGASVKIPGFIVPLDVGKDGLVTEFFLVPYFGACIHVPPPPPNQIVYVKSAKGIALDSIYEAYWITGKMTVQTKSTRLGAAAYSLDAEKVEIYKY